MFTFFTCSLLLTFTLLHSTITTVDALCLPCQAPHGAEKTPSYPIPERRTVYSPKITSPNAATTWVVGSEVNVTWDLDNMPQNITNTTGKVVLGYLDDETDDEHLDLQHPLAHCFDIRQGEVKVKVPTVDSRNDYIIVLFGDSGNSSPKFTIN